MSSDRTSPLAGSHGLLRGQRAKSYGSLVTSSSSSSSSSPARQRRIEHKVQPGETLQGLSLRYGVSMEQIKRANRLYTNDSIFLKNVLFIPVLMESVSFTDENELHEEVSRREERESLQQVTGNGQADLESREATADLSPSDYLKRMDSLINQSKQAAVKTCQDGDQQFSSGEQLHTSGQGSGASFQGQQAVLGAVPLTITKRTKKIRDEEDEIFQL